MRFCPFDRATTGIGAELIGPRGDRPRCEAKDRANSPRDSPAKTQVRAFGAAPVPDSEQPHPGYRGMARQPVEIVAAFTGQEGKAHACYKAFGAFSMVRSRRLELPLRLRNSDLNAARLPIPPRPHP
jgi:hypothetical protein